MDSESVIVNRWKDVVGFENLYEISNAGILKSKDRYVIHYKGGLSLRKGKEFKLTKDKDGYLKTCLQKEGKRFHKRVHILVAEAFIPNPKNKPEVNHKDGDKSNNFLLNLEWTTTSENRQHAFDTGLQKANSGEKHYKSKLNKFDVKQIRSSNLKGIELAKKYNVSPQTISRVKLNKSYRDEI